MVFNIRMFSANMKWKLLLLLLHTLHSTANSCKKELTYHQTYSYGYIITCDQSDLDELDKISVYNELSLTITSSKNVNMTDGLFHNVRKIRELNITDSNIQFTQQDSLKGFSNLKMLTLDNDHLNGFSGKCLGGLDTLRVLNLPRNQLERFAAGSFIGMEGLLTLNLNANKISRVTELNLCDLLNLETLFLAANKIAHIESNALLCLANLKVLHLEGNLVTNLDMFLAPATLSVLNLGFNRIKSVDYVNATNLSSLDLRGNKLEKVEASSFLELPNLETLVLSENAITFVDHYAFRSNNKLKTLDFSGNHLTYIYLQIPSLENLSLADNKLADLLTQNLTHLIHLKTLNLSKNHLTAVKHDVFKSMHALSEVNLRGNRIQSANFSFDTTNALSLFDLSANNLTKLSSTTFKHLKNLKALDLSHNRLQNLNDTVFQSLINLQVLNMSYNQMTNLDYQVVDPLEELRVLDVAGNHLTNIDYSLILNELPNLDVINVNNNLLSCEFLGKMITYFKDNSINFTVNEQIKYDRENVAGIYCKETEHKLISLEEANAVIVNNTRLLNELYAKQQNAHGGGDMRIYGVVMFVAIVLLIVCGLLFIYKYQMWNKRKNYIIDELELITNEPYKTFG